MQFSYFHLNLGGLSPFIHSFSLREFPTGPTRFLNFVQVCQSNIWNTLGNQWVYKNGQPQQWKSSTYSDGELFCFVSIIPPLHHSITAKAIFVSNPKRSILNLSNPITSFKAMLSPFHSLTFNSSKAITLPFGILGRKCDNATLVGR